jgi:hypothetical protein
MMRRITSLLLAIAFVVVSVSGIQMVVGHKDRAPQVQQTAQISSANVSTVSTQKGEKSFYPKTAHEWFGYLFIGAGLVHLGLNLKPMKSYLGLKKKK